MVHGFGHGVNGVTCDKNIKSVPYGHIYRKSALRACCGFSFGKRRLSPPGWGMKRMQHGQTINYAMHFTAAEVAKAEPEHLLNWLSRWPNFSWNEIACKGDGTLMVNYKAMDCLQSLRRRWGRPITISSGFRSPAYNARVGGAAKSLHMQGRAFDIPMKGYSDAAVVSFIFHAVQAGFTGFGMYLDRPTPFIHIDTGAHRTWQSGQSRLDDTDDVTEILPSV